MCVCVCVCIYIRRPPWGRKAAKSLVGLLSCVLCIVFGFFSLLFCPSSPVSFLLSTRGPAASESRFGGWLPKSIAALNSSRMAQEG